MSTPTSLSIGLEIDGKIEDTPAKCEQISSLMYNFVALPLLQPEHQDQATAEKPPPPFTVKDLVVRGPKFSTSMVAKASKWIDMESKHKAVRTASEEAFRREINWCAHLSIPSYMMALPPCGAANTARLFQQVLLNLSYTAVWLRTPMEVAGETQNPWFAWDSVRSLCKHNQHLALVIEVGADIPAPATIARWLAEPVKAIVIPTSIFISNAGGYPVLSKKHQQLLYKFFKLNVQVIVEDSSNGECDVTLHRQYLSHLHQKRPLNQIEKFAQGYEDVLQSPLQPLRDNLESQTYETFEKDPVKYERYEEAVFRALMDRPDTDTYCVMVLGAGRGPLVQRSLVAAERAKRKIRMYAVEKNPNAILTLQARVANEWGEKVTLVASDMREWDAPEKADIVVSELLGSFSDNELSPECLDGFQPFLKDDGISIPCDYTSFMAPLQSWRLHSELGALGDNKNYETHYVVQLVNANTLAAAKPVFKFVHPNKDDPIDNTRYEALSWTATEAGVIHGFAGYFESTLYKDVMISTNPETHSDGMFSWFPLYIPIKEPIRVKAGETITAHIWRQVDKHQVWYEWCVTEPACSAIHNPNARGSYIGL